MSQNPKSKSPFHKHRAGIAGVLLFGAAGLLQPAAYGGGQGSAPELLGASKKSVGRILGDGQPLVSGLFNEESSESHSGGIGSTHAYRTRIGYIRGRSCYAFFMKKTGESFNPIEVIGLLYLCANRAEWREVKGENYDGISESVFIYQVTNPKGMAAGRTYLATLDETACKLFVYSPEWRPDFNRELWITPDEAPVHREAESEPVIGKQPRRSNTKQADSPGVTGQLFGKPASAPDPKQVATDPKQVLVDPKQGIYLPKLNQVVPADPGEDAKATKKKRGKRKQKRRQQQTKPIAPATSK